MLTSALLASLVIRCVSMVTVRAVVVVIVVVVVVVVVVDIVVVKSICYIGEFRMYDMWFVHVCCLCKQGLWV